MDHKDSQIKNNYAAIFPEDNSLNGKADLTDINSIINLNKSSLAWITDHNKKVLDESIKRS